MLQRLSTDEFTAPSYYPDQLRACLQVLEQGHENAGRLRWNLQDYWASRLGTASGLLALNEACGEKYFDVRLEDRLDADGAAESLGGNQVVIDVQTHFMADRKALRPVAQRQIDLYREWGPQWWTGLSDMTFYGLAEYLRCVFLQSETAVAILTAPPPDEYGEHFLTNEELAGTRQLLDGLAGTGRLLNHTVVHPSDPEAIDRMTEWRDRFQPVGWKVYTMGHMGAPGTGRRWEAGTGWMLDDEAIGLPFLDKCRELGVRNICSHKGLSGLVDNGSPRDIGPAARLFPELNFIVYHSGYEPEQSEGPFTQATSAAGINRLIESVTTSDIKAGSNVYAELGTTWFCLIKQPEQAAHVLGKLLLAFGEDNILWGTDSIWYGPTQPVIDAFRAFQIPERLRAQHDYPELTDSVKEKILSTNAAHVYGIDLEKIKRAAVSDEIATAKAAINEYLSSQKNH